MSILGDKMYYIAPLSIAKEEANKKGYLSKRGGKWKNWRLRYFVLKDNMLYYFSSPNEISPRGVIPLEEGTKVQNAEDDIKKSHSFAVATPAKSYTVHERLEWDRRTYYFVAKDDKERAEWMYAIQNAKPALRSQRSELKDRDSVRGIEPISKNTVNTKSTLLIANSGVGAHRLSVLHIGDRTITKTPIDLSTVNHPSMVASSFYFSSGGDGVITDLDNLYALADQTVVNGPVRPSDQDIQVNWRAEVGKLVDVKTDLDAVMRPLNDFFAAEMVSPKAETQFVINKYFQHLLEMRVGSIDAFEERLNKVNKLSDIFATCVTDLAKIIISELHVPRDSKTIKQVSNTDDPVSTYVHKDIVIKFTRDTPQALYGGESIAMKAVGDEWKSLQELLSANVFHLHQPLMTIVDFMGFRVCALAKIPVTNANEPLYGYSLAKRAVVNQISDVDELMKQVGTLFNLKPHKIGKVVVDTPGDLKVHMGEDGRFYVVNTARLFPPVTPCSGTPGAAGVLYRRLRPEFMKFSSGGSLSPDAFLNWGSAQPSENLEVVEATQLLLQTIVPAYAQDLLARFAKENISLSSLNQQLNLSVELHDRGINIRYIALVYVTLQKSENASTISKFFLLEIIARTWKHIIRSELRKAIRVGHNYKSVLATLFTAIFGENENSEALWARVKADAIFRFELYADLNLRQEAKDEEFEALLFDKLQKITGVELNIGLSKVIQPENINSIAARTKVMKMNVNGNVNVLIGLGRFSDAEALIKRQLEARKNDKNQKEMAAAIQALGELYSNQPERETEAEQRFVEAITILEKEAGNDSLEVARAVTGLGAFYRRGGKSLQATEAFTRALNIIERVGKLETGQICTALLNLGEASVAQAKFQEARPLFVRASSILDKHMAVPAGPGLASLYCNLLVRTYHNMASLSCYQAQHNQAEDYCDRAIAIIDRMESNGISSIMSTMDQKGVAIVLDRLGQTFTDQQRIAEAERVFLKAIDVAQKALGSTSYHVATIMNNLAYLYSANGFYEDTENLYKTSISILETTLGLTHAEVGVTIGNLAVLYKRQGKFEEAAPLFERALEITKQQLGPDHPKLSDIYYNIHSMYFKQQKWDKALPYLEKSIGIDEKVFGPFHPEVLQSKMELEALRNKVVTLSK